jgi:hypothetical protein
MWTRATISWEFPTTAPMTRRRALSLLALPLLLLGCGGGGGGTSDPGRNSVVTARATLVSAAVIEWVTPLDIPIERIIEYQVLRDGVPIAVKYDDGSRFYNYYDSTREEAISYRTPNGTILVAHSGNHSPVQPGKTVRYQVRMIYQQVETSGLTTYAERLLNTPGVATTPLALPVITEIAPKANEVQLRFPRVTGADQYQIELSTRPDFPLSTRVTRGPLLLTSGDGLVTSPWPGSSTSGTEIYYRLGVRATKDAYPPQSTSVNGDDLIYSVSQTIVRP